MQKEIRTIDQLTDEKFPKIGVMQRETKSTKICFPLGSEEGFILEDSLFGRNQGTVIKNPSAANFEVVEEEDFDGFVRFPYLARNNLDELLCIFEGDRAFILNGERKGQIFIGMNSDCFDTKPLETVAVSGLSINSYPIIARKLDTEDKTIFIGLSFECWFSVDMSKDTKTLTRSLTTELFNELYLCDIEGNLVSESYFKETNCCTFKNVFLDGDSKVIFGVVQAGFYGVLYLGKSFGLIDLAVEGNDISLPETPLRFKDGVFIEKFPEHFFEFYRLEALDKEEQTETLEQAIRKADFDFVDFYDIEEKHYPFVCRDENTQEIYLIIGDKFYFSLGTYGSINHPRKLEKAEFIQEDCFLVDPEDEFVYCTKSKHAKNKYPRLIMHPSNGKVFCEYADGEYISLSKEDNFLVTKINGTEDETVISYKDFKRLLDTKPIDNEIPSYEYPFFAIELEELDKIEVGKTADVYCMIANNRAVKLAADKVGGIYSVSETKCKLVITNGKTLFPCSTDFALLPVREIKEEIYFHYPFFAYSHSESTSYVHFNEKQGTVVLDYGNGNSEKTGNIVIYDGESVYTDREAKSSLVKDILDLSGATRISSVDHFPVFGRHIETLNGERPVGSLDCEVVCFSSRKVGHAVDLDGGSSKNPVFYGMDTAKRLNPSDFILCDENFYPCSVERAKQGYFPVFMNNDDALFCFSTSNTGHIAVVLGNSKGSNWAVGKTFNRFRREKLNTSAEGVIAAFYNPKKTPTIKKAITLEEITENFVETSKPAVENIFISLTEKSFVRGFKLVEQNDKETYYLVSKTKAIWASNDDGIEPRSKTFSGKGEPDLLYAMLEREKFVELDKWADIVDIYERHFLTCISNKDKDFFPCFGRRISKDVIPLSAEVLCFVSKEKAFNPVNGEVIVIERLAEYYSCEADGSCCVYPTEKTNSLFPCTGENDRDYVCFVDQTTGYYTAICPAQCPEVTATGSQGKPKEAKADYVTLKDYTGFFPCYVSIPVVGEIFVAVSRDFIYDIETRSFIMHDVTSKLERFVICSNDGRALSREYLAIQSPNKTNPFLFVLRNPLSGEKSDVILSFTPQLTDCSSYSGIKIGEYYNSGKTEANFAEELMRINGYIDIKVITGVAETQIEEYDLSDEKKRRFSIPSDIFSLLANRVPVKEKVSVEGTNAYPFFCRPNDGTETVLCVFDGNLCFDAAEVINDSLNSGNQPIEVAIENVVIRDDLFVCNEHGDFERFSSGKYPYFAKKSSIDKRSIFIGKEQLVQFPYLSGDVNKSEGYWYLGGIIESNHIKIGYDEFHSGVDYVNSPEIATTVGEFNEFPCFGIFNSINPSVAKSTDVICFSSKTQGHKLFPAGTRSTREFFRNGLNPDTYFLCDENGKYIRPNAVADTYKEYPAFKENAACITCYSSHNSGHVAFIKKGVNGLFVGQCSSQFHESRTERISPERVKEASEFSGKRPSRKNYGKSAVGSTSPREISEKYAKLSEKSESSDFIKAWGKKTTDPKAGTIVERDVRQNYFVDGRDRDKFCAISFMEDQVEKLKNYIGSFCESGLVGKKLKEGEFDFILHGSLIAYFSAIRFDESDSALFAVNTVRTLNENLNLTSVHFLSNDSVPHDYVSKSNYAYVVGSIMRISNTVLHEVDFSENFRIFVHSGARLDK